MFHGLSIVMLSTFVKTFLECLVTLYLELLGQLPVSLSPFASIIEVLFHSSELMVISWQDWLFLLRGV